MAKAKSSVSSSSIYKYKTKKRRPGVHAKTKTSSHKHSKNYVKLSTGQGKQVYFPFLIIFKHKIKVMNYIVTYVLVFITLFAFNILKTLEIRYTYQNKLKPILLNSIGINIVSLLSNYFSINSLLKGDYFIMVIFIVGSLVGKYVAMVYFNNKNNKL